VVGQSAAVWSPGGCVVVGETSTSGFRRFPWCFVVCQRFSLLYYNAKRCKTADDRERNIKKHIETRFVVFQRFSLFFNVFQRLFIVSSSFFSVFVCGLDPKP
jgi:hypothetical protein